MSGDWEIIKESMRGSARYIETDGTPAQIGLTPTELREAADALEALQAENAELRAEVEQLKDQLFDVAPHLFNIVPASQEGQE